MQVFRNQIGLRGLRLILKYWRYTISPAVYGPAGFGMEIAHIMQPARAILLSAANEGGQFGFGIEDNIYLCAGFAALSNSRAPL
jgi:hypothetical protein